MTLNLRYKQGERIIVTLTNGEIVEGEYDGGTEDRIDIFNAKQYPECSVYPGLLSYYKTEIQTITLFKEESVDENNSSTGKSSPNKQAENEESQKIIRIPKLEYERLKELSLQYTYFATPDRRYLEAVEYLNSCENVGVVGIGSERGRLDMIHLLVMSSWDKVYIIDLLQFRRSKFPEELKGILESDDIKKIVHNSRTLVDCLHHRHQVNLKNIFDVQVILLIVIRARSLKIFFLLAQVGYNNCKLNLKSSMKLSQLIATMISSIIEEIFSHTSNPRKFVISSIF